MFCHCYGRSYGLCELLYSNWKWKSSIEEFLSKVKILSQFCKEQVDTDRFNGYFCIFEVNESFTDKVTLTGLVSSSNLSSRYMGIVYVLSVMNWEK